MRVIEARHIEHIEALAIQQKSGLVDGNKISPEQWEAIRANQQLVEQWRAEHGAESD